MLLPQQASGHSSNVPGSHPEFCLVGVALVLFRHLFHDPFGRDPHRIQTPAFEPVHSPSCQAEARRWFLRHFAMHQTRSKLRCAFASDCFLSCEANLVVTSLDANWAKNGKIQSRGTNSSSAWVCLFEGTPFLLGSEGKPTGKPKVSKSPK